MYILCTEMKPNIHKTVSEEWNYKTKQHKVWSWILLTIHTTDNYSLLKNYFGQSVWGGKMDNSNP